MVRKDVIYDRFSSDMQNPKRCDDQEHDVRLGLKRRGIDDRGFIVINDEAQSGTKDSRTGFQKLMEMSARGELGILAVDDQSRLSRTNNAAAVIQDLVFNGGRFISTGENIDTNEPGWEMFVKVAEVHNAATITKLRRGVRSGHEGRIRAGLTAGDYPYGYESYYVNPEALNFIRRGPKPEKNIRIKEDEARWVRQIFVWFCQGVSMCGIARLLNKAGIPLPRRCRLKEWKHWVVSKILSNEKYIGHWEYGKTTTLRNSTGKVKQIAVAPDKWTIADRPDLRIIDQSTWERAQARGQELLDAFGYKEGQKKRGAKLGTHYSNVYPTGLLDGLLYCGQEIEVTIDGSTVTRECGSKLHHRGKDKNTYRGCPNSDSCGMRTFVRVDKAKTALLGFVRSMLLGTPEWVNSVLAAMRSALAEMSRKIPSETAADDKRLGELRRQIDHLVDGMATSGLQSETVMARIVDLEAAAQALEEKICANSRLLAAPSELPDQSWFMEQLHDLASVFEEETPAAALLLRRLLGKVSVHAIIPPGKQRGYAQLRFTVDYWQAIKECLSRTAMLDLAAVLGDAANSDEPQEVRLDIGGPTRMDVLAPKIAQMRAQGVHWDVIQKETGLDPNAAYKAWRRFTDHQKKMTNGQATASAPQEESAGLSGNDPAA